MKDIPVHRQAFIMQLPLNRIHLSMVLPEGHHTAFWAIPIFNCTPLWMTINGVQDLNACTGRLEGILNRSLSRGDPWNKTQACPGGHLQVCPRWGPVRGDGGGVINAIVLYCPVGGGGGGGLLLSSIIGV